jgi:CheY-like chemotaxis protein
VNAKILIADDDPAVAGILAQMLGGKHYEVLVVHDGFELVAKAAAEGPHLIITDIQMPGAYGTSVYRILKKEPETACIPVLFISGHPLEKVRKLLPEDPKTRFLRKPITQAALDAAMHELLPLGGYNP